MHPINGRGAEGFNGQNGKNGYGASIYNGQYVPHNYTTAHPQMSNAQAGGSEHDASAGLKATQHDPFSQHARQVQPMDGKGADGFNGQDGQNGYGASVVNGKPYPSSTASQPWMSEAQSRADEWHRIDRAVRNHFAFLRRSGRWAR